MQSLLYDGSFEGWLCAVFAVYEYKFAEVEICPETAFEGNIFENILSIYFDEKKAERVYDSLRQKISKAALQQLYFTFLSEKKGIENIMLQYAKYVFSSRTSVEYDYSHPAILAIKDTARKVAREKHRMEAFVRFQKTKDELFYAVVQPDFNVLPIITPHFTKRYADQQWLIYDTHRKYGIHYNLHEVSMVEIQFSHGTDGGNDLSSICNEDEPMYQQLWQQYFKSTNIEARKNTKLHLQHMPRRYWKNLTEKKPWI